MSEQIYTYRDISFNLGQAYYYTLLIQIDAVSFSYGIVYKKQLIAWDANCSLNELSDPQELAEELSATYKKVVIGLPANGFTLVPRPLFKKDKVADYARLLDVKPTEKVLAQVLDAQNFIIYTVDEKIISSVEKFDLANTVYLSKGWITAMAQKSPATNDLYLYTENEKVEFLTFKDGRIRFYNRFEFKSADDLVYFTAFVTNELNMPARSIRLNLGGDIKPGDEYHSHLAEFFTNINFSELQLLDLPEQILPQQVSTLATLSLCGSLEVY
jgi:hypothetical protein